MTARTTPTGTEAMTTVRFSGPYAALKSVFDALRMNSYPHNSALAEPAMGSTAQKCCRGIFMLGVLCETAPGVREKQIAPISWSAPVRLKIALSIRTPVH